MANNETREIERLRRLLSANEPATSQTFLSVPQEGQPYHIGTTLPIVGSFTQLSSGLWVPLHAQTTPAPLDYMVFYVAFSDVENAFLPDKRWLVSVLSQLPLKQAATTVASVISAIRGPSTTNRMRELDRASLDLFREPIQSRLSRKLDEGGVIHAPQLLMILMKLILAICPESVCKKEIQNIPLPLLLLVLADTLKPGDEYTTTDSIPVLSELSLEITANQHFNASYRADSEMSLFQRRWVEMAKEAPSRHLREPLTDVFATATECDLVDMASLAVRLFGRCSNGQPLTKVFEYMKQYGWNRSRLDAILRFISMPIDRYREATRRDLRDHTMDWYFTTIGLFPLIRFDDEVLVIDPDAMLRRCLGFIPFWDIEACLQKKVSVNKIHSVRRAFDEYSERYVTECFKSMMPAHGSQRVYSEADLMGAYRKRRTKIADAAIDYGSSWVVAEVTTRPISRDTVNAVSIDGLIRDRDAIVLEAEQVASTIELIKNDERRLTGVSRDRPPTFYPIIVLTEGFPTNPSTTTLIREELNARNIMQAPDVAAIEVLDIVELDMIEAVAEATGGTLPEILQRKASSGFRTDSIQNFIIAHTNSELTRPRRVAQALERFFADIAGNIGASAS